MVLFAGNTARVRGVCEDALYKSTNSLLQFSDVWRRSQLSTLAWCRDLEDTVTNISL